MPDLDKTYTFTIKGMKAVCNETSEVLFDMEELRYPKMDYGNVCETEGALMAAIEGLRQKGLGKWEELKGRSKEVSGPRR